MFIRTMCNSCVIILFLLLFNHEVLTRSVVRVKNNVGDIIDHVNNISKTTWKAGLSTSLNYMRDVEDLMGVLPIEELGSSLYHNIMDKELDKAEILPESYDASKQWPLCKSITSIKDQSNCGSCWALSTASVFSDRVCIGTNGSVDLNLSGEFLMDCCNGKCGRGCDGGHPEKAWKFIKNNGICTGGDFGSGEGCQPYSIAPCSGSSYSEPSADTPKCYLACSNFNYTTSLKEDLYFASKVYTVKPKMKAIMHEVYNNGPVVAAMKTYEDFLHYKSGIYQYTTGSPKGEHAVKLLGWGQENGVLYWLAANTWGRYWGMGGMFKIKRGNNECGIENRISGGLPKF
ncbi:cathepsin B-like cysteine proteinase 4 [Adelges cooleyi]|uniref:cathepsin B-like cysteine proteinase 4 n=1 Tax=Adelges cooleyi TaxID=133065 RepID=UPI0021800959|nr:cathepsin B-like cysteine proteinase 4 [Adelges cooleyi]